DGGKGRAASEADLLAAVEALRLANLAQRPPEPGAVLERDLETARREPDRRRPPARAAAVEVRARECAGHSRRYANPTSAPSRLESASPVAVGSCGSWTMPVRSRAPSIVRYANSKWARRTSTHG